MPATQLLIEADNSSKDKNNIRLSEFMMAHDIRKSSLKSKFFLQISDHRQSIAPTPSMDYPYSPKSVGGR
jgi:hypothetical protein